MDSRIVDRAPGQLAAAGGGGLAAKLRRALQPEARPASSVYLVDRVWWQGLLGWLGWWPEVLPGGAASAPSPLTNARLLEAESPTAAGVKDLEAALLRHSKWGAGPGIRSTARPEIDFVTVSAEAWELLLSHGLIAVSGGDDPAVPGSASLRCPVVDLDGAAAIELRPMLLTLLRVLPDGQPDFSGAGALRLAVSKSQTVAETIDACLVMLAQRDTPTPPETPETPAAAASASAADPGPSIQKEQPPPAEPKKRGWWFRRTAAPAPGSGGSSEPAAPGAAPVHPTVREDIRLWRRKPNPVTQELDFSPILRPQQALWELEPRPDPAGVEWLLEIRRPDGSWPRAAMTIPRMAPLPSASDQIRSTQGAGTAAQPARRPPPAEDYPTGKAAVAYIRAGMAESSSGQGTAIKWTFRQRFAAFWNELSGRKRRGDDNTDGEEDSDPELRRALAESLQQGKASGKSTAKAPKPGSSGGQPGLVGLANLGNTCYMNSAVQCLLHTEELTSHFLAGRHLAEVNADNPLGQGGAMAHAWGDLVSRVWALGEQTPEAVSPDAIKAVVQKANAQFEGFRQHDSQELLGVLLDTLQEDLNRLRERKYVVMPQDDGALSDHELAGAVWDAHRRRYDNIILDLFAGQHKSTVVCPQCGHRSRSFDPFFSLSLPLPWIPDPDIVVEVFVANGPGLPPVLHGFRMSPGVFLRALRQAVAKRLAVDDLSMVRLAEIRGSRLVRWLKDDWRPLEYCVPGGAASGAAAGPDGHQFVQAWPAPCIYRDSLWAFVASAEPLQSRLRVEATGAEDSLGPLLPPEELIPDEPDDEDAVGVAAAASSSDLRLQPSDLGSMEWSEKLSQAQIVLYQRRPVSAAPAPHMPPRPPPSLAQPKAVAPVAVAKTPPPPPPPVAVAAPAQPSVVPASSPSPSASPSPNPAGQGRSPAPPPAAADASGDASLDPVASPARELEEKEAAESQGVPGQSPDAGVEEVQGSSQPPAAALSSGDVPRAKAPASDSSDDEDEDDDSIRTVFARPLRMRSFSDPAAASKALVGSAAVLDLDFSGCGNYVDELDPAGGPRLPSQERIFTSRDLYDLVLDRLRHLVPEWNATATAPYPFRLAYVSLAGDRCGRCRYSLPRGLTLPEAEAAKPFCSGCWLPPTPFRPDLRAHDTLAVEWLREAWGQHVDSWGLAQTLVHPEFDRQIRLDDLADEAAADAKTDCGSDGASSSPSSPVAPAADSDSPRAANLRPRQKLGRRRPGDPLDLEDCLELFAQPEQLSESEAWLCGGCRQHQRAIKRLQLWRLPKVLVIQLNRFRQLQLGGSPDSLLGGQDPGVVAADTAGDVAPLAVDGDAGEFEIISDANLEELAPRESVSIAEAARGDDGNPAALPPDTPAAGPGSGTDAAMVAPGSQSHGQESDEEEKSDVPAAESARRPHTPAADRPDSSAGRFRYGGSKKLDQVVDFPLEDLCVDSWVADPLQHGRYRYDLYAVSEHSGSISGGHYTAWARHHQLGGQWYLFNDRQVSPLRGDIKRALCTGRAYILFYRRRELLPGESGVAATAADKPAAAVAADAPLCSSSASAPRPPESKTDD